MKTYLITKQDLDEDNYYIGDTVLSNYKGNIKTDKDIQIVMFQTSVKADGDIISKGDIIADGDIISGGNIISDGKIIADGILKARGFLIAEQSITCERVYND